MSIASGATSVTTAGRATAPPTAAAAGDLPLGLDVSRADVELLASAVAADGVAAHPTGVLRLAEAARAHGVPPVVVDVLLDGREPEVARQRALAVAARRLTRAA